MDNAEKMLDAIMRFNRKERYHLIRHAVTGGPMSLSDGFRREVGEVLDLSVPDNAYVAMDYHLDWLSAAYHIASKGGTIETAMNRKDENGYENYPNDKSDPVLAGNILDTDLLIAYRCDGRVVVILVEAKADSDWSLSQISDKAARLKSIFDEGRDSSKLIKPYFLLLGPSKKSSSTLSKEQADGKRFPSWFFVKNAGNQRVIPHLTMTPDMPLYAPTRVPNTEGRYSKWKVSKRNRFHPNKTSDEQ